jgi:hypothetical protein
MSGAAVGYRPAIHTSNHQRFCRDTLAKYFWPFSSYNIQIISSVTMPTRMFQQKYHTIGSEVDASPTRLQRCRSSVEMQDVRVVYLVQNGGDQEASHVSESGNAIAPPCRTYSLHILM